MTNLRSILVIESLFCINRSYLAKGQTTRLFCNLICAMTTFSICGLIVHDVLTSKFSISFIKLLIIVVFGLVLLYLALTAVFWRKVFLAISRLDAKFSEDNIYDSKMKSKLRNNTMTCLIAALLNFTAGKLLDLPPSLIFLFGVSTTAHDAEMCFVRILLDAFNLRLEGLKVESAVTGSRVYRHVLIAASHFSEDFSTRILVMLVATIIKTVMYSVIIILGDSEMLTKILLMGPLIQCVQSLWMLCESAADTDNICKSLASNLAARLVLDKSTCKEKSPALHYVTRRLYFSVTRERPRYMSGAVQSIDLNVPLYLLDASVNYLLIIIQVYVTYWK